jgi:hypothetical protein
MNKETYLKLPPEDKKMYLKIQSVIKFGLRMDFYEESRTTILLGIIYELFLMDLNDEAMDLLNQVCFEHFNTLHKHLPIRNLRVVIFTVAHRAYILNTELNDNINFKNLILHLKNADHSLQAPIYTCFLEAINFFKNLNNNQ